MKIDLVNEDRGQKALRITILREEMERIIKSLQGVGGTYQLELSMPNINVRDWPDKVKVVLNEG